MEIKGTLDELLVKHLFIIATNKTKRSLSGVLMPLAVNEMMHLALGEHLVTINNNPSAYRLVKSVHNVHEWMMACKRVSCYTCALSEVMELKRATLHKTT